MSKKIKKDQNRKKVWIMAGRDQFAEHGLKGINIDHLSMSVGVARTSFYHFFKTKDQFLKEIVDYWIEDGSERLIKNFEKVKDPKERLMTVYELALRNKINDQFLVQLRIASVKSQYLKRKLEEIEDLRLQFIKQIFLDSGNGKKIAYEKAKLVYFIYLGFFEFHKVRGDQKDAINKLQEIAGSIFFN